MKAILVIDMPKCCSECPCFYHYNCIPTKKELGIATSQMGIPIDFCPLKPVHSLKSGGRDYIIYERQFLYDNLDREIEMIKKGKEIYESNISG